MGDGSVAASGGLTLGTSVDLIERPTRIGPYRILDTLGAGGMGVVYLAEQLEPVQREVAIKVLRTGDDSELVLARFNAERQALAVMDHPNITKVFDAGVTEHGWPYFVMERVVGAPLGEYVSTRVLSIVERLALFGQICRAIQHAHQKGIIHRDIKPSNIIVATVDGAPVCKVIDFGIAKATQGDGGARLTMTGITMGTPAYMSPEQALGSILDVDTRSDIYSLGVVLYELLAGILPFETSLPLMGVIAHHVGVDTIPPSVRVSALDPDTRTRLAAQCGTDAPAFVRALSGDLDWITLKALEKERDRRYQTAAELATDIERHLSNRPVSASPPSRVYLARKFIRRHRTGVAFAITTLLLIIVGAAAIVAQSRRVSRARAVAVQRRAQAEELISFMLGDLRTRLSATGGLDMLEKVGKAAQVYFEAVPEQDLSDEELFRRSQALRQIGEVRVDRGDLVGAMPLFRQSLALVAPVAARDSMNGAWQLGLGASHFWVGYIHFTKNDLDSALAHFTPYLAITKRLVARRPDSLLFRIELGEASSNVGSVKESKGDLAGALVAFREAIGAKAFAVQRDSTNLDWQLDLATSYNSAGVVQRKLGDYAGALASFRNELAVKRYLVARDPPNLLYKRRLATTLSYLANLELALGRTDDAARDADTSRMMFAALAAADSSNQRRWNDLKTLYETSGVIALEQGRSADALASVRAARSLFDRWLAKTPDNEEWQTGFANLLVLSSDALLVAGHARDAEAEARRAIAVVQPIAAKQPAQLGRIALTQAYLAAGRAAQAVGDTNAARHAWTAALAVVDSTARATNIAELRVLDATALASLGRVEEARPIVRMLVQQGYRRPRWVAQMQAAGLSTQL